MIKITTVRDLKDALVECKLVRQPDPDRKLKVNQLDENGLKAGRWEEPDPHGGVVTGSYIADERQGKWVHKFADGRVRSEFNYDAGELTGECTWYRATGGPMQKGTFLNDQKHGLWQRWTAAGDLLDEGHFDRDTKIGEWIVYNPDGSVKKRSSRRIAAHSCQDASKGAN